MRDLESDLKSNKFCDIFVLHDGSDNSVGLSLLLQKAGGTRHLDFPVKELRLRGGSRAGGVRGGVRGGQGYGRVGGGRKNGGV